MIIRRGANKIVFECDVGDDGCEGEFTADSTDFHNTWLEAKERGWETKKFKDEWLHACPRCIL